MRMLGLLGVGWVVVTAAGSAHAQASCAALLNVEATQPADDQTDVPVDTVIRLFLGPATDCGVTYGPAAFHLETDAFEPVEGELVGGTSLGGPAPSAVWKPKSALLPDTRYAIIVSGKLVDRDLPLDKIVYFTTGTRKAASTKPTLELVSALYEGEPTEVEDGRFYGSPAVTVRATLGAPNDGLSLLSVRPASNLSAGGSWRIPAGSTEVNGTIFGSGYTDEPVCMIASEIDAAGKEGPGSEKVCVTPSEAPDVEGEGCSVSATGEPSSTTTLLGVGLAAVGLRLRRRRRAEAGAGNVSSARCRNRGERRRRAAATDAPSRARRQRLGGG